MSKPARIRRTPEESRQNILAAAERLLTEQGPQTLRLADVAKEAGVVNATVLHHFGTIDGVHKALMEQMIADLVGNIVALEVPDDREVVRGFAFKTLIDTFQDKGAARLAAWLELTDETKRLTSVREAVTRVITEKIHPNDVPQDRVEDVIMISVILALGVGLFGRTMEAQLGKEEGRAGQLALELLKTGAESLVSRE